MDRTVRQYIRRLEQALADRAEGPRVFTQKDYHLAVGWHERGIPVGLVLEVLEQRRTGPRSLVQVAARVEESWKAVQAGSTAAEDPGSRHADSPAGPERDLQAAVAGSEPGSDLRVFLQDLLDRFNAGVSPSELERLVQERLPGVVSPEQLEQAELEAGKNLHSYRGRMPPESFRETIRRGALARLRKAAGIPRFR